MAQDMNRKQESLASGGADLNERAETLSMVETGRKTTAQESSTGAIKPKKQLQKFYEAVLDKNNQNFLYRLVKQSCLLQKDDKGKDSASGATERTQMVTLALRTLQMFDF